MGRRPSAVRGAVPVGTAAHPRDVAGAAGCASGPAGGGCRHCAARGRTLGGPRVGRL